MSAKLSIALDYLAKAGEICIIIAEAGKRVVAPVSYTHLTLPTKA